MKPDFMQIIWEMLKNNPKDPGFTDNEYNKLIQHFKKGEYNQFYSFIIIRVYQKKDPNLDIEELIPALTATLSDKVGNSHIVNNTDEEIISLIIDVYGILFLIDIEEIRINRF